MATELKVELSDLGGWADEVGRAGEQCSTLSTYVEGYVPNGDFGRILELITDHYEAMTTSVRTGLTTDGERLAMTRSSLVAVGHDFRTTDAQVAQSFGAGAAITNDGQVSSAFTGSGATAAAPPTSDGQQLPEVSFGWLFDKACELIHWVGGPDLRAWVTDQIAGDVGKAGTQASAWANAATALRAVETDLAHGDAAIRQTWTGDAATSAGAYLDQWLTSLKNQASAMDKISGYLHDMIGEAVDMAQVVVDIVKEIMSIISAGWSMASIPIYGEIKLVDKVKDAIKLVNDARKVITVFWNALKMVIDGITMTVHFFEADSLPGMPSIPSSPA